MVTRHGTAEVSLPSDREILITRRFEAPARLVWEALTDERVRFRRAPFDNPQLFVPNGHPGDETMTEDGDGDGQADDDLVQIPPVGAAGGPELKGFLEFGAGS